MTVQDHLDLGHDDVAPRPVLVTVKDAARMLAISRSTVYGHPPVPWRHHL